MTKLLEAVKRNDISQLNQLLKSKKYKDPNSKACREAFVYACGGGSILAAKCFIGAGIDVNCDSGQSTVYNCSPLFMATRYNHLEIMTFLIKNGAEVNQQTRALDGSPIHAAADHNLAAALTLLLDSGANVNATKIAGETALYMAASRGNAEVVNILLERKADPNITMKGDRGPLHMAAEKGHDTIVKTLINSKAKVDIADDDGETPLFKAVFYGRRKTVQALLSAGANPNRAKQGGDTPLIAASRKGRSLIAQILLNAGAEIDRTKGVGATPLYIAAQENNLEVALVLIHAGADTNKAKKSGASPLFIATQKASKKMVKLLLAYGASIECPSGSAFIHARELRLYDIMHLLKDFHQNSASLQPAWKKEFDQQTEVLITEINAEVQLNKPNTVEQHTQPTPASLLTPSDINNFIGEYYSQKDANFYHEIVRSEEDTFVAKHKARLPNGTFWLRFSQSQNKTVLTIIVGNQKNNVVLEFITNNQILYRGQCYSLLGFFQLCSSLLVEPLSVSRRAQIESDYDISMHLLKDCHQTSASLQPDWKKEFDQQTEVLTTEINADVQPNKPNTVEQHVQPTPASLLTPSDINNFIGEYYSQKDANFYHEIVRSEEDAFVAKNKARLPNGTFWLRFSQSQNKTVLTIIVDNQKTNVLLEFTTNNQMLYQGQRYSLPGFFQVYSNMLVKPLSVSERTQIESASDAMRDVLMRAGTRQRFTDAQRNAVAAAMKNKTHSWHPAIKTTLATKEKVAPARQSNFVDSNLLPPPPQSTPIRRRSASPHHRRLPSAPPASTTENRSSADNTRARRNSPSQQYQRATIAAPKIAEATQLACAIESHRPTASLRPTNKIMAQQQLQQDYTAFTSQQAALASLETEIARLKHEGVGANTARINELQAQHDVVAEQVGILFNQFMREQARIQAIEAFSRDPRLADFYSALQNLLGNVVIGYKAAASGVMQIQSSEVGGHFETAAEASTSEIAANAFKSGAKKLGKVLGKNADKIISTASQGITLLGHSFEFLPGVGALLKGAGKVAGMVAEKRAMNRCIQLSEQITMPIFLSASQQLAFQLTQQFKAQLLSLPLPSDEKSSMAANAGQKLFKSNAQSSVRKLAEYATMMILESFHEHHVPDNALSEEAWVQHWLDIINKPRQSSQGPVQQCLEKLGVNSMTVITQHKARWNLTQLFTETGIQVPGAVVLYYAKTQGGAERYGFRIGTQSEAKRYQMVTVSGPHQSASTTQASSASVKHVAQQVSAARAQMGALELQAKQMRMQAKRGNSNRLANEMATLKMTHESLFQNNSVELQQEGTKLLFTFKHPDHREAFAESLSYLDLTTDCRLLAPSQVELTVKTTFLANKVKAQLLQQGMGESVAASSAMQHSY